MINYFVSYVVKFLDGSVIYSNKEIHRDTPITSIDDIRKIEKYTELTFDKIYGRSVGRVDVINWRRFEEPE